MRRFFRLLPMTIFAAALLLSLRVGDLWTTLDSGVVATARAEAASQGGLRKESRRAGRRVASVTQIAARGRATATKGSASVERDAGDISEADARILGELNKRRKALAKRARNLDMREGLIKAAEKRVDQKLTQLKKIRVVIEKFVKKYDEQKEAKLVSLVKIYEKMKPKSAALVFEKLDMRILLDVLERMKEARSAPILAAMTPDKVKDITMRLVTRSQFPSKAGPKKKGK